LNALWHIISEEKQSTNPKCPQLARFERNYSVVLVEERPVRAFEASRKRSMPDLAAYSANPSDDLDATIVMIRSR
jgi:hypothetical protein